MIVGNVPELVLMNLGNSYFKWKIHFINSQEILVKWNSSSRILWKHDVSHTQAKDNAFYFSILNFI